MTVGGNARFALSNATNFGDLGIDLGRWQDATLTGLGALRELQFKHPHLRDLGDFLQARIAEIARRIADPVFGGADLKNNVAAPIKMKRAEPPLARIEPDTCLARATTEGRHSGARQGPVAHARDIEERWCIIRNARGGADQHRLGRGGLIVQRRKGRVHKDRRARHGCVAGGAEGNRICHPGTGARDPFPLRPVEGQLLTVHRKEVLTEELSQSAEQMAKAPKDRIVAPNGILRLRSIRNEHHKPDEAKHANQADKHHREDRHRIHRKTHRTSFPYSNCAAHLDLAALSYNMLIHDRRMTFAAPPITRPHICKKGPPRRATHGHSIRAINAPRHHPVSAGQSCRHDPRSPNPQRLRKQERFHHP